MRKATIYDKHMVVEITSTSFDKNLVFNRKENFKEIAGLAVGYTPTLFKKTHD